MKASGGIDDYISKQPENVRPLLEQIRSEIRNAAPKAEETIKYGLPTFTLNGNLVHFGAFKKHIGFYPVTSGIHEALEKELEPLDCEKGTLRFPIGEKLPLPLIRKIVKLRVKENASK
ncbi:iron chaperone [Luteolibacter luteus]|uniref:YdhG-like domain-containing protein n=1 Tax=Luteolibacter luteus TaxID=2728835 RepID=A0A858RPH8_9BACT|nr:DUF1801 domain-containing protein [Luteolibacter luteus]QJE98030.1 hypothetical protein HHL09_20305 [Luteolibacter luteus]